VRAAAVAAAAAAVIMADADAGGGAPGGRQRAEHIATEESDEEDGLLAPAHGSKPPPDPRPEIEPADKRRQRLIKWSVLAILVVQNAGTSLLLVRCPVTGFNSQTGVIMQEALKAAMCLGLVAAEGGCLGLRQALRIDLEVVKTSVPAILYLVQNNLFYVATRHMDAPTFAVLYQGKIFTAAIFSVILLGRALTCRQWLALCFLAGGAVLVVLSQTQTTSVATDVGASFVPGLLAVLMATVCSGLAGVYFEKLLKGSTVSLAVRNLHLAGFSVITGVVALLASGDGQALSSHFFDGYTTIVWSSIINNAGGGLLVAVVLKYADNILKCFATNLAIIVTIAVSTLFFHTALSPLVLLGTACVLSAIFLYSGLSPSAICAGAVSAGGSTGGGGKVSDEEGTQRENTVSATRLGTAMQKAA